MKLIDNIALSLVLTFIGLTFLHGIIFMHQVNISWILIISGNINYSNNDIVYSILHQDNLHQNILGSFCFTNIFLIKQKIKCHFSGIKNINIYKRWPNILYIYITERVPIAFWNKNSLIDSEGNTFVIPITKFNSIRLPIFYGPENSKKDIINSYYQICNLLSFRQLELKSISITSKHSWQMIVNNDIKLNIGCNNLIERVKRFVKFYPILINQERILNKKVSYVDLRYKDGVAIGWK